MPDQKIQTSLHGHRIGLSANNDLILDKSKAGLGTAGHRYAEVHPVLVRRGQLTSAQLLAMNATPISVIPAPGAGFATIVMGALFFLDYNSAAYVAGAGEDLVLRYTNGSGLILTAAVDGGDLPAATADAIAYAPGRSDDDQAYTLTANAAVVAHILTGEWVTGNSPINYEVYYRVVPITLPTA